uniref:delta(14)-sterol reductase LBR-like isoform X2 n=1 Tax=Pristiophorus japonicus TaxID=55135 RepID=UPI00398EAC15
MMSDHSQNQVSSLLRKKQACLVSEETDQTPAASPLEKDDRFSTLHLAVLCVCLPGLVLYLLNKYVAEDGSQQLAVATLWDLNSFLILVGFVLFQAALYLLPIGKIVKGKRIATGERDDYCINGFYAFLITVVVLGGLWFFDLVDVTIGHDKCLQLAFSGILVSLFLSIVWFLKSFTIPKEQLMNYRKKRNFVQEFCMGRELNPKFGKLNIKFFSMLRIAFIGWALFILTILAEGVERNGRVSPALGLVVVFQLFYILDALYDEESILFTKEIVNDTFGYIMTFGEMVWIPFTSSLQALYLVHHPQELSYLQVAIIIVIYAVGIFIYCHSNKQKNNFRRDPQDVAFTNLETIDTGTGKKLLVSEWWGWLRHPNYLGDIIVHLAWSLPCGFSHIIPYLQLLLCVRMLIKRATEIEEDCHGRYGAAWEEYCRRARK